MVKRASQQANPMASYQAELRRLAAKVGDIGFISPGSLVRRYTTCGKPGCRCGADPPQPHGPYWQWSRALQGKTITRRVSDEQAPLYQEWIANRRRLQGVIADIEDVSRRATALLLARSQADTSTARHDATP